MEIKTFKEWVPHAEFIAGIITIVTCFIWAHNENVTLGSRIDRHMEQNSKRSDDLHKRSDDLHKEFYDLLKEMKK